MWLRPALLALFSLSALVTVSAQGDDTVSIKSDSQKLVEGSAEDNGNSVMDVMITNESSARTTHISYTLFPGIPAGTYHARMTGTIYNGNTALSGTNTVTTLSNTFSIRDSGVPCSAGTFTPIKGLTDPAYQPVRITSPVGGEVISQPSITGPFGSFVVHVNAVDVLFRASLEPATMEVINTVTGFNAGVQNTKLGLDSTILYNTNNVTLDPGSWKVRMNFTILSPAYLPGKYSLESEEFFVVAEGGKPNCTSSSGSSSTVSGGGPTPSGGGPAPSGSTANQSSPPTVSGADPSQSSPPAGQGAASLPHNPLQSLWVGVLIPVLLFLSAREL